MIDLKDAKVKYIKQKNTCKHRLDRNQNPIEFQFTFEEWLDVWQESGKWNERGRGKGAYVMSRKNDIGPYSKENIDIVLSTENNSEGGKHVHHVMSDANKLALRKVHLGAKRSEETKRKMSEARKGRAPWNKGMKMEKTKCL